MTAAPSASPPAACCSPLAAPVMSEAEATITARAFKALADPHRVRILNLLVNNHEPVCVCDITEHIALSQSTTSFHLKKLTSAGLLERRREGTWAYYSITRDSLRHLRGVFDAREGRR